MAIVRIAIVVAVVVVALFSLTANGELISKCIGAYAQECSDQESPAGIEKCCSMMVGFYNNDADCLCSIYEYTGIDSEAANRKLTDCGANTEGSFSCSSARDRVLYSSFGSAGNPSSAPSHWHDEPVASPESAVYGAGYKNTFNGISVVMTLVFLAIFVAVA